MSTDAPALTIAYVGNFEPEHSTENHVRAAAERLGHTVVPLQENTIDAWNHLHLLGAGEHADLVLWTRTGWDWQHMCDISHEQATVMQLDALDHLADVGVPTVGFHLDRWWGLDREAQVFDEPFFRSGMVITAEGGREDEWAVADVNHHWLPPGVLLAECERPLGTPEAGRPRRVEDVIWVGSWNRYHPEWRDYRVELVTRMRRVYRNRFGVYPRGRVAARGAKLTELYGRSKVVVGDSCLAGDPTPTRYWSDRIPETLGRGGLLVHPWVEGLEEWFTPGEHLLTYTLHDFDEFEAQVAWALAHPTEATEIREAGRAHVMKHHTYERRVEQVLVLARADGLL